MSPPLRWLAVPSRSPCLTTNSSDYGTPQFIQPRYVGWSDASNASIVVSGQWSSRSGRREIGGRFPDAALISAARHVRYNCLGGVASGAALRSGVNIRRRWRLAKFTARTHNLHGETRATTRFTFKISRVNLSAGRGSRISAWSRRLVTQRTANWCGAWGDEIGWNIKPSSKRRMHAGRIIRTLFIPSQIHHQEVGHVQARDAVPAK